MNKSFPILDLLKKPRYLGIFMAVFAGLGYLNYYLMANLPGEKDLMCVLGGGLTASNGLFAIIMSIMAGLIVIGFLETLKHRSKGRFKLGGTATLGMGLGTLTAFCSLCTIPVISLFGISLGLSFLTDYEAYIKALSLLLLGVSLYLVNQQQRKDCGICKI